MNIITTIARILVGVLFIISGLIKANDPVGFSYKLDEYFEVFHMDFMSFASLGLAMFIAIFEIGLGAALLLGARIRNVVWMLLGLIVFFTFLTFYSAYFNKVTDCGCFGDALHLTPWTSFGKDVTLLVLIGWLFFRRNDISPLVNEGFSSTLAVLALIGSGWFTQHCYAHLPIVDFRPYAVGKNLIDGRAMPAGAKVSVYETKLYYEKKGEVKEFTSKDYPWNDSTWVWKETKNVLVEKGYEPPIHDFNITDQDGVDRTDELLSNTDYNFFLVSYDLSKADRKVQAQINQFVRHTDEKHLKFIGLTGSLPAETDNFRHDVEAMYDFYTCDQTALKTMIRSNPGLMLMKGGVVIAIWHCNDFPEFKEVEAKYLNNAR